MIQRFVALGAVALSLTIASVASAAQPTPAPAPAPSATPTPVNLPTMPPAKAVNPYVKMGLDAMNSIVRKELLARANSVNGQVTYFKRFEMQVRFGSNGYRSVHLHQGTVIDPRGSTIAPGQRVAVTGVNQTDGSLDANVITIQQ